ncbi:hypothetical protein ACFPRL_08860 [Pseudoclavibacter helvolus]
MRVVLEHGDTRVVACAHTPRVVDCHRRLVRHCGLDRDDDDEPDGRRGTVRDRVRELDGLLDRRLR